jgi:23S rRNA (pseudouridine1915-N3)-methyltransferase
MRLVLLAVGKLKPGPERDLAESYVARAKNGCRELGLGALEMRELPVSRRPRADDRRAEEAVAISAAAPAEARLALLDERGQLLGSEEFSADMAKARDAGVSSYVVAIGGPDGFDPSLRSKGGLIVSFGRMTWPHQLMRAMAAEQIYRATTIMRGHPYHRA